MAEAFSNKVTRAAGIVSTSSSGAVGILTNLITGISTVDVAVNDLVDNTNFILGTKVSAIGVASVTCDRDSTNTSATSNQSVNFLGPTTAYTSPVSTKSILVGGTFSNNTNNNIHVTVELLDSSVGVTSTGSVAIASKIPVPGGSSFVISDTGKTVLESKDEIRVYCDTNDAVDVSLSVLTGVN